jgi:hypothetical protein
MGHDKLHQFSIFQSQIRNCMHGTLKVRQLSYKRHDIHDTLTILMKIIMKTKVKIDLNT